MNAQAMEAALKETRRKALLDAAGDVCEPCKEGSLPYPDGAAWIHRGVGFCFAGPIYRRIKEEAL